jgi:hypothetical protein
MDDKIKNWLEELDEKILVPENLSQKIQHAVSRKARVLHRKEMFWAGVKLAVSLGIAIYALTAIILTIMDSSTYLSSLLQTPKVIFSREGFNSFMERVPILSMILFSLAAIYSVRHMVIKGLHRNKMVYQSVFAVMAIFVLGGTFLGGMAIGSNSSEEVQNIASESLFEAVTVSEDDYEYSTVGTVITVKEFEDQTIIVVKMDSGFTRAIKVTETVLANMGELPEVGDRIFALGGPSHESSSESSVMEADTEEAEWGDAMEGRFIQIIES